MRVVGLAFLLAAAMAVGCGGKGGGSPLRTDGGGNNDAPQDIGKDTGPVVTSVPDHWSRPADCMGVGEMCNGLGCGAAGMCQLDGDVCVPRLKDINNPPGYTADTPYCLAYSCMTYEQASCFCTGPAGAMYPSCKTGPAAVAGLCAGESASCDKSTCCNGLDCVAVSPTSKVCYDRCAGNTDCDTGCCTDRRDTGDLVCAPQASCDTPCTKRGQACTKNEQCCNGICVTSTNPDFSGCRPSCTTNADCDTGCCQPFSNGGGFCTDPGYCGCGSGCAAGSTCTSFDGKTLSCRKDCMVDTDCPSVCCSGLVDGTNHGVCITAECTCPGGCTPGSTCLTFDGGATYSCLKNCTKPSDCSTNCCSQNIAGKNYGSCLPAASCAPTP